MNGAGINWSPDYGRREKKLLSVPLAGDLAVDKLQVLPKRDVDAAIMTSQQLAEVVCRLAKRVEDLAERWAHAKQQLAELVALHHAELKQRDEEFAARIAKLEARLNNRH